MAKLESTVEAFRKARERSSVAASIEAGLLHTAIYDAREAGLSVRKAAAALGVHRSTVARHWREGHHCPEVIPMWGSAAAWREAYTAVWSHDEQQLADDRVPYTWEEHDGARHVASRPRGAAVPALDEGQIPEACAGGVCGHCKSCKASAVA